MGRKNPEDEELLKIYAPLRVADVRDGMDWMGYHHYGSLDPKIRPMYRTKAVGIAKTVRYLPFTGPAPAFRGDEYTAWSDWYYKEVNPFPFNDTLEEGDFICIDVSGVDVGLMGSCSGFVSIQNGAVGFVLNGGGQRDSDEDIMEEIPTWCYFLSQPMVQARLMYDAMDIPVAIGGVTICPGDIVVADNDGVIVVPRKDAFAVAKYAHRELYHDKDNRKGLYDKLGWEHDATVENTQDVYTGE